MPKAKDPKNFEISSTSVTRHIREVYAEIPTEAVEEMIKEWLRKYKPQFRGFSTMYFDWQSTKLVVVRASREKVNGKPV